MPVLGSFPQATPHGWHCSGGSGRPPCRTNTDTKFRPRPTAKPLVLLVRRYKALYNRRHAARARSAPAPYPLPRDKAMTRPLRVLHLEDEALDTELIAATLSADGLASDLTRVFTRPAFGTALAERDWDLILADYALPAFDGFAALTMAQRDCPDVPFIFVSGRMGEDTVAEVLKAGATDCVFKTRLGRLGPAVRRARREAEAREEQARAEAALHRQAARLTGLAEASRVFAEASLDQSAVIEAVGRTVMTAIGDGAMVLLRDEHGRWQPPATVQHDRPDTQAPATALLTAAVVDGHLQAQLDAGLPLRLSGADQLGPLLATAPPGLDTSRLRGLLAIPLRPGGELRGLLAAWRDDTPQPYTEDDLAFLQDLADRAALTLETARLYAAEQRARQSAEQAAERTGRLQSVTAALGKALTPPEVAEVILSQGVAATGARGGQIMRLSEDGTALQAMLTVGYPDAYAQSFTHTAVTDRLPSSDVVRSGLPLWIRSHAEFAERYPVVAERRPPGQFEAVAVAPLRFEGRVLGTLVLSFAQVLAFAPEDQALLLALAQQCAQALERARLYAQTQALNAELEARVEARTAALRQANTRLEESREQLRSLSARLQAAREDERAQIAHEIHDDLGQQLSGVMMDLAWLQKRLRRDQAPLLAKAQSMAALLNTTIRSVRQITSDLRPGLLDDLGLLPAIEWQLQEFERRSGTACELRAAVAELPLPPASATAVFRVFQEILSNVARHAQATRVTVTLDRLPDGQVQLAVTDNGRGISTQELTDPNSLGLLSMRERARVFGGELSVTGQRGEGTTVRVRIPLPPA